MISGDAGLRSYNASDLTWDISTPIADRVSFHCIESSEPNLAEQNYMFRTDCDNGMRAQILFQSCWDGVNLYLENSEHVTYQTEIGNGGCPSSHPVVLPLLFYEVLYMTNDIDQSAGGSFLFSEGDETGYSFHGDFLNGWNQDVLEDAVENCLTLASNPDGTVSTCAALSPSDDVNFPRDCPQQPMYVAEPVNGLLTHLPGCNYPSAGPDYVQQIVCAVGTQTPVSNSTGVASNSSESTIMLYSTSTITYDSTVYTTVYASATTSTTSLATSSIPLSPNSSSVAANSPGSFYFNPTAPYFPNATATSTYNFPGPTVTTYVTITVAPTLNTSTSTSSSYFLNDTIVPALLLANNTALPTFNASASASASASATATFLYPYPETTVTVTVTNPFTQNTTWTASPLTNNTYFPTESGVPAAFLPTNVTVPYFQPTVTTDYFASTVVTATETFNFVTTTATYSLLFPNASSQFNTAFITRTQPFVPPTGSA